MKFFGSISRLVSLLFRQNSQDVTLRPNQGTTYSAARDVQLPPGDTDHVLSSATSTQTFTNKSISGSTNTITNVSLTTGVTGTLPAGNGGTGITSLGSGIPTFLGTPSSANLAAAITDETGTGALVFATSPALVTPDLGTPSAATLTNATGLPIVAGTTGTLSVARGGTNSTTALNNNRVMQSSGGAIVEAAAITAARALASDANGIPVASATTATELSYVSGVTSALQTQLNAKASTAYVDAAINGLSWKQPVLVATTANITLSGEQTVDGVTTSASRVLVKDQTLSKNNGIYVSAAGAWSRSADMDSLTPLDEFNGAAVFVEQGTSNASKGFVETATVATIGTDPVTFAQFTSAGAITYTANRALQSDGSGLISASAVTSTELGYVSGVTSAIQTQINTKLTASAFEANWVTGDGTTKTVTHNLGGTDCIVQLFDKSDNSTIGIDSTVRTDANTVTLTASEAPGGSGWRVLIVKLG
jgi:hypothetical protein